jgi:hypothetical protein
MNVTIHKQIIDLMEEAGELGITLNAGSVYTFP